MAVMVTLTLDTDVSTYEALHAQLLQAAIPAGMLLHTSYESDGTVKVADVWPSAEAFQAFMAGPAGEGMQAMGIPMPTDVAFQELLHADGT
jgi:hypothetical protein